MSQRTLAAAAGAAAGVLLFGSVAAAAPGAATGNVNMRTGPSTRYAVITTIPAGAPLEIMGCQSWCQVVYAGRQGYVSASYVATGYQPAPRAYYQPAPPVYYQPYQPYYSPFAYRQRPHYWRDDYRYRHRPRSGIHFEFGF